MKLFLKNKTKTSVLIYDDNKLLIATLSCKGREIWIQMLQSKEEENSWLGAMVDGARRDFSMVEIAILIIRIMLGHKDDYI